MKRSCKKLAATFLAAALVTLTAGVASADQINSGSADADTLKNGKDLTFGDPASNGQRACSERGTAVPGVATLVSKTSGDGFHFANGAALSVSGSSDDAGITVSGSGFTLPNPWSTSTERPFSYTTTVTNLVPWGNHTVSLAVSDGTHSVSTTYTVTVGTSCAVVPRNTAPSLTVPGDMTVEGDTTGGANVSFTVSATDTEDNPDPVPSCSPVSGSLFPVGTTTVNCSVTDSGGLSGSGSFSVAVQDTTPPTVTPPANITAEATSAAGAIISFGAASGADIVDGPVTPSCLPASGGVFALGVTTVTCSAADVAGNSGSATFTVTVQDTTGPSLTGPSNITLEATGSSGAVVTYTATGNDIVDGPVTPSCLPASGSGFALGNTTVTCTMVDSRGNTGSGTFIVKIEDTTKPVLALPGNMTIEATSPAGAIANYSASASDIVSGPVAAICNPAAGATFTLGATTVNCSATDSAGNTATGSFTVTVVDTTPPVVTPPGNVTAEATSSAGTTVNYSGQSATDLVSGSLTPNCLPASGGIFPLGATTVTCTATDGAGNTGSATFTVTVVDTTPPVVTPPGNVTAEATSSAGTTVNYSGQSATDLVSGSLTPNCLPASGGIFPLGATTVTCTATDGAGNTGSATFTVTVVDTTPPVVTPPGNVTAEATSSAGTTVNYSGQSATDLVSGSLTPNCLPASGGIFPLGATTVTCTATDAAGNTGSASFTVTVVDTTAPAVTVPANMVVEATGPGGATATFSASATDAVSASPATTCSPLSGSTFALGATTVTCTATDAAGNTGSASFTVTVVDTTAPVVTVPANVTALATGPSGAIVTYSGQSVTDLVDGTLTPSCVPPSGGTFPLGPTTVTCTATDAAGNSSSASFTVTVTYNWTGFFAPIDNLPMINSVKAGSAVPVKFRLGGNQGLSIVATGYPKSINIACDSTATVDAVESTVTAGSSSLSYDAAADQYVYVWKTDKTWAGTCRQLVVKLADGTYHFANFKLQK